MKSTLRGLYLHLDPVSGIAGDMTVAALVDAGVPAKVVSDAVAAVGIRGLHVRFETRRRGAFVGRGFIVDEPGARVSRARKPPVAAGGRDVSAPAPRAKHHDEHARPHHQGDDRGRGHAHRHDHVQSHDQDLDRGPARARGQDHDRGHGQAHRGDHAHDHDHDHGHGHARSHDHDHDHAQGQGGAHEPLAGRPDAGGRRNHDHRDYAEIRRLLKQSGLDPDAKALAEEIFARLAEVEAALHGTDLRRVAFHEVGAFDSIADIVGMSAAVAWLAPSAIGSSFPVVGTGTVRTAHGIVPVPAPATAALLRDIPMVAEGPGELTTPTGAAFLATVVDSFGPPPPLRVVAIGYGAGARDVADRANVLRAMLGEPVGVPVAAAAGDVLVLETNVDDMTGQLIAALCEALFKAGALDVWSTPIAMKKGRPGHQISALAEPSAAPSIERAFFLNSTTLGIRIYPVSRHTLARSFQPIQTAFGPVDIKIAALEGKPIVAMPEYENCRRLASAAGIPVREVWTAAVAASAPLFAASPSPPPRRRTTRKSIQRRPS